MKQSNGEWKESGSIRKSKEDPSAKEGYCDAGVDSGRKEKISKTKEKEKKKERKGSEFI